MATKTNRQKVQDARAVADVCNIVQQSVEEQKVPQLRELLMEIGKKVTPQQIATLFKERIEKGLADGATPGERNAAQKIIVEYASLLKSYQQMTGELTTDEIGRMADWQLDAILRDQYGLTKTFSEVVAGYEREESGREQHDGGGEEADASHQLAAGSV